MLLTKHKYIQTLIIYHVNVNHNKKENIEEEREKKSSKLHINIQVNTNRQCKTTYTKSVTTCLKHEVHYFYLDGSV